MRRVHLIFLSLCLFAAAATPQVNAQARQPDESLKWENILAARVNPLGLFDVGTLTYRKRLIKTNNIFVRNNFIGGGVSFVASPSFFRVGPIIELQPFSLLSLFMRYEALGFFDTFGNVMGFQSATADYSDSGIDRLEELDAGAAVGGEIWTLGAKVQMKFGQFAARSQVRFIHHALALPDSQPFFYDPVFDVLVRNRGWHVGKDTDLLFLPWDGFAIGARWSYTEAIYNNGDFAPGEDRNINPAMHRVGPFFAYRFGKGGNRRFAGATVVAIVNWWLTHRFRTGQDVSTAVPYVALALKLEGDLLAPD